MAQPSAEFHSHNAQRLDDRRHGLLAKQEFWGAKSEKDFDYIETQPEITKMMQQRSSINYKPIIVHTGQP